MNPDEIIKQVGAAIAKAFDISDGEQLLQIVQNMSDAGIQEVANIVATIKDEQQKIQAVQKVVQQDIQKKKATKAQLGAKLEYINSLKRGSKITTMKQEGDPGSINSTEGMKLNKKQRRMLPWVK